MIQGNTKGKVRQPVKDYECFQTHNTNTDGTFTLGLSLKKKKNRTDQGHYRIFNFVIIKISRLIKSMFLFISLPEAPSPNCIHQSWQTRDEQQYYGRDFALRQILLMMFGCILVLKRLRTEKTWTWARSAIKCVTWEKQWHTTETPLSRIARKMQSKTIPLQLK